jgi:hypothetical protein
LVLAGETVALTAFGISWLIKGAVFMRDHWCAYLQKKPAAGNCRLSKNPKRF